jgi:hypothetical protein
MPANLAFMIKTLVGSELLIPLAFFKVAFILDYQASRDAVVGLYKHVFLELAFVE